MYMSTMGDLDISAVSVTSIPAPLVFNSTKYPGTCKPSDSSTLAAFKSLQNQMNRIAESKGISKIAVDGDIGPGTIALASKTVGTSAAAACSTIASLANVLSATAKAQADMLGAPAKVSGPAPIKAPTLVNAAGIETAAPPEGIAAGIIGAVSDMSTVGKLAAVAMLGGIGYFLLNKKRKGKRK